MNLTNKTTDELLFYLYSQIDAIRKAQTQWTPRRGRIAAGRFLAAEQELKTRLAAKVDDERQRADIECRMAVAQRKMIRRDVEKVLE